MTYMWWNLRRCVVVCQQPGARMRDFCLEICTRRGGVARTKWRFFNGREFRWIFITGLFGVCCCWCSRLMCPWPVFFAVAQSSGEIFADRSLFDGRCRAWRRWLFIVWKWSPKLYEYQVHSSCWKDTRKENGVNKLLSSNEIMIGVCIYGVERLHCSLLTSELSQSWDFSFLLRVCDFENHYEFECIPTCNETDKMNIFQIVYRILYQLGQENNRV